MVTLISLVCRSVTMHRLSLEPLFINYFSKILLHLKGKSLSPACLQPILCFAKPVKNKLSVNLCELIGSTVKHTIRPDVLIGCLKAKIKNSCSCSPCTYLNLKLFVLQARI